MAAVSVMMISEWAMRDWHRLRALGVLPGGRNKSGPCRGGAFPAFVVVGPDKTPHDGDLVGTEKPLGLQALIVIAPDWTHVSRRHPSPKAPSNHLGRTSR
ncbi:hypothetical protein KL86PLE_41078 [uncultured Pleomorphomonas sp.]|uniref:Uncharacterized protein n=1 Tax=uncultured Pleomorphomonas sp. TaxID=442121 RepID=A0A212LIA3_9HYPH|nr:hypothetical protein KL86PLE_41078 [uncultured Pleomorphomonas sp.]